MSVQKKEWISGIKEGIDKSCHLLIAYESERKGLHENYDLHVKDYMCPCGKLGLIDGKDKTEGEDYLEIMSEKCGF